MLKKRQRHEHSGFAVRHLFVLAAILFATSRCDIPTESPSFAVNPTVRVPLIFSEGFVLIGPNSDGVDGLIDTTSATFDSLFIVDPNDRTIFISQRIDDFDLGDLDGLIDPINLEAIDFETDIARFKSQEFDSEFTEEVGTQISDPANGPTLPPDLSTGQVLFPAETSTLLEAPQTDMLDLSEAEVTEFEVNSDGGSFNRLSFTLTNNQAETLTDGTFAPGSTPDVVIERTDHSEIARVSFPSAPAAGQTVAATFDLRGLTLPADSRYRFDVGTASGMTPITSDPQSLGVSASITETHYSAFTLESLQQQDAVDLSQPDIEVQSEYDFQGAVTSSGQLDLTVYNDLPVPIRIEQLEIRNIGAVGQYPGGHIVAQTSGQSVAPRSTSIISLPLGQNGVGRNVEAIAFASSPGSNSSTRIQAADAIRIVMSAAAEIDQILIRPAGESISEGATVAFDVPDISMPDPTDFVELSEGQLTIDLLTNEMDVSLNAVQLSFPDIRTGAFGVGDSLVVTIPGGMPRSSTRTDVAAIDLANTRIYATGDQLTYHLSAVSETAGDVRAINVTDRIVGSISASDLMAREIAATIEPITVNLGTDVDGDGFLDVLNNSEAQISEIGLDQLSQAGVSNLTLAGAELSFDIETDVTADLALYGAIVGVSEDGSYTYLAGIGEHAVTPGEVTQNPLHANGVQLDETQMIRLDVAGSTTVGKIVQQSVVLNDENSTIANFIGSLPQQIRFVGRAVLQPEGGPVQIREDFVLGAGLAISIPLSIRDSFNVNKDIEADLSSLADLSEPGSDVEVNRAELLLDYVNGLPLGLDLRVNFVDGNGSTLLTLPADGSPAFSIGAGTTNGTGFTTQSRSGNTSFSVTADELTTISRSAKVELEVVAQTGSSGVGRIRSDDKVELSLSGNFDITVTVGG